MAYFKLTSRTPIRQYPYDYHSHFGGILPLEIGPKAEQRYAVRFESNGQRYDIAIDAGETLSLLGLVMDRGGDPMLAAYNGQRRLFAEALRWAESDDNPLRKLAQRSDPVPYERGECVAENVYIAAVLLAEKGWLAEPIADAPAESSTLYRSVREQFFPVAARAVDRDLAAFLAYFNRQFYTVNEYTPFDDAYKMRSSLIKALRAGPDGEQWYRKWMLATFAFLHRSGVRCSQIALGPDEVELADAIVAAFNREYHCQFRLLAHTAAAYLSDQALRDDLERKIMPFFRDPAKYKQVIGLDLLGTENKVANYTTLLEFLRTTSETVRLDFGPSPESRARAMAIHIHCGEGAAADSDHRSMVGYARMNLPTRVAGEFYRAFAAYIRRCAVNAARRNADNPLGVRGARARIGPEGLFDELFRNDSITWAGLLLRRFDINTPGAAQRAAFNGKRNAMAIVEAFDQKPQGAGEENYYQLLTGRHSTYAFRLGHDFYYRGYVGSKLPKVAFDTNLGSNAITGASGLFWSADDFRINHGFRHLEGYIDTGVLDAANDAVVYMGVDALSEIELQNLWLMASEGDRLSEILDNERNREKIIGMLRAALGPIAAEVSDAYALYCRLALDLAGRSPVRTLWLRAMANALVAFHNWRCYLLGADGQGVEQTDLQDEFLRMLLMVAYQLLPGGQTAVNEGLIDTLQTLMLTLAGAYWATAVSPALPQRADAQRPFERFEGYKGPSSAVVIERGRAVEHLPPAGRHHSAE
jgi:hypothetical protein